MTTNANSKIPTQLVGVAGEYFVAAELSRRGYIASISLRNTRGIDILATNSNASRSVTIQCKTSQHARADWVLSEKCEKFVAENHYYIFDALTGAAERPRFFVVPSADVARRVEDDHRKWLATPGRRGQAHAPTAVRNFHDREEKYLERWDLLRL